MGKSKRSNHSTHHDVHQHRVDERVQERKKVKPSKDDSTHKKATKKSSTVVDKPPLLPVTLLSGFLGAGKTTLLKHILESNQHRYKIAVIVNDMAALNIDASLIANTGLIQSKEEFITMQNGCICCTLRYDLMKAIKQIYEWNTQQTTTERFDYVVIESTGISEPMQVAETFCLDPETSTAANHDGIAQDEEDMLFHRYARLDTCVTVIDSKEFPLILNSKQTFAERFTNQLETTQIATDASDTARSSGNNTETEKHISQLLIEQVEFANVIILNKMDLLSSASTTANNAMSKEELVKLIQTLNPNARILTTSYGEVKLDDILNTQLFSMEDASQSAGWLQSLAKDHTLVSEREEYDIFSFVYRARRPFHPARLATFLREKIGLTLFDDLENTDSTIHRESSLMICNDQANNKQYGQILRSKGFCWLASRHDVMVEWGHNGNLLTFSPLMPWYVDNIEALNSFSDEEREKIQKDFIGRYGDRRQEIVFIGIHLNQVLIVKELDDCLLNDEEFALFERIVSSAHDGEASSTSLELVSSAASDVYYDPLPPWTIPIDRETTPSISWLLRDGHVKRFQFMDSSLMIRLTQCNVFVNIANSDISIEESAAAFLDLSRVHVHIWLSSLVRQKKRTLIATLRPFEHDHQRLNVMIAAPPAKEQQDDLVNSDDVEEAAVVPEDDVHQLSVELHYVESKTLASLAQGRSSIKTRKYLTMLSPFLEVYVHGVVELNDDSHDVKDGEHDAHGHKDGNLDEEEDD